MHLNQAKFPELYRGLLLAGLELCKAKNPSVTWQKRPDGIDYINRWDAS